MATIQLLIENEQNRRLLADALSGDHEVRESAGSAEAFLDAAIDLCVLDGPAFRGHRETLATKKDRESPVFLPALLLLGDRDAGQPTDAVWERVDEVIETPIDRAELENRVANLLERRDLSLERKRRQEFTEERFRTLFESTPDPIVVVTDDGVVTEVNDAFTRLFGLDREAVVGSHVADIPEPVERLLLRVQEADVDGTADSVDVESRSGDTHVTELNVDVVEELGGATERIGIFRDVTGREEYRRQLERQIEQLERFASVVSHDLRDPLNTARAKVRLARAECDSEKLDELEAVHDRMAALIEDVLTLAKQGHAIGETEPVELAAVAEAAWSTVDAPAGATLTRDGDLPVVEADEERLRALLENLFRNSVEHSSTSPDSQARQDAVEHGSTSSRPAVDDPPEGGPADVTVTIGGLDDRRGFYVADDGPGIPESKRADVFEYGTTSSTDGTGLGLAIVDQVAEAHGWTVDATESASGGARFEVSW